MPKAAKKRLQPRRAHRITKLAHRKPQAIQRKPKPELTLSERVEQVLIAGDLQPLAPQERVEYYHKVCQSLGLNWLTCPFTYILFREGDNSPAKLQLYANKDCAAQLRKIHGISILSPLRKDWRDGMFSVECDLRDRTGKTDTATGVVALWKWKDSKRTDLIGKELANALMKCETKAKRRGTLSICGLAFLDESELDTMQIIGGVTRDGRVFQYENPQLPAASEAPVSEAEERYKQREKEGLEHLTPEQREVVERRMREAEARKNAPIDIQPPRTVGANERPKQEETHTTTHTEPQLVYRHYSESDTWRIGGSSELVKAHMDLLQPLWSVVAKAFVANAKQLGHLIRQFELRKVPFREYGAQREPGE